MLIRTDNLSKTYYGKSTQVHALKEVNLGFQKGEFCTIAGPSGSGKSTFLNLVGLLDHPTNGNLSFLGNQINFHRKAKLHQIRLAKIGFIFQSFNLMDVLSARENVEYPMFLMKKSRKERATKSEELLKQVGLWEQRNQKPGEMSGGQCQRVAIARALANDPELILADEPTANLDSEISKQILELMHNQNRKKNVTFIFSSHDQEVIKLADRKIWLHDGVILEDKCC
jgi:putative ABC transport system ATP-binding protein